MIPAQHVCPTLAFSKFGLQFSTDWTHQTAGLLCAAEAVVSLRRAAEFSKLLLLIFPQSDTNKMVYFDYTMDVFFKASV